jgi:hypothetical protein
VQTRTRNAIAFAAAAAVATAGLAAVAARTKKVDLAPHALDAVPAGALIVAVADLDALRASPVGAPFLREGREIPGLGKVRDVCGFDPMDTLTEVAVAVPAGDDSGDFGLAAAGRVDDEAIIACAAKVIQARGGQPVIGTEGSFRTVIDAGETTTTGEIAARRGGLLLLGAGTYLHAMIAAADGRGPTVRSSKAHGMLGREVGDASVRVSVVLTPEQRRMLSEELAGDGEAGSPAGSIVAGALGVRLGPTVAVHAVVACDAAPACAALAQQMRAAKDARAADFSTRLVGFGAVFEQLRIDADGPLIHARVELPAEQATTLAERLLTLRGMRHPMPKADGSGPPARGPATPRAPAPPAVDVGGSPGAAPGSAPNPPDEVLKPTVPAKKDGGAR